MNNQNSGKSIGRRDLLKSTAALAAAGMGLAGGVAPLVAAENKKVLGANDRISVGVIGSGRMGQSDMTAFAANPNVQIDAVCDCYKTNLDLAVRRLTRDGKPQPKTFADFRKLLDMKELNVVIVASPDHWHPLQTVMACRAGKDVYVEKPVSVTISEGRKMVDVARETGRIVGVGTQQRSGAHFQRARDIVQSGKLGKITWVRTWNYGNEYPEGIDNPPDSDPPKDLDWDMWLGPAPKRPFNANRFGVGEGRWSTFRYFWDYAGGWMTDWGTHLIDIVLWAMNVKGPRAVCALGGKYALLDNRDTPDTFSVTYEFPGFVCTYENRLCADISADGHGYGIEFHGTEGALFVDREGYSLSAEMESRGGEQMPRFLPVTSGTSEQHATHVRSYLECVRSRRRFISDIEDGHLASSTPHLANIAYRLGRTLKWNPDQERFAGDAEADKMLSRVYRAPWSLA